MIYPSDITFLNLKMWKCPLFELKCGCELGSWKCVSAAAAAGLELYLTSLTLASFYSVTVQTALSVSHSHLLTHSPIHAFTLLFTHSLIHSLIHSMNVTLTPTFTLSHTGRLPGVDPFIFTHLINVTTLCWAIAPVRLQQPLPACISSAHTPAAAAANAVAGAAAAADCTHNTLNKSSQSV